MNVLGTTYIAGLGYNLSILPLQITAKVLSVLRGPKRDSGFVNVSRNWNHK